MGNLLTPDGKPAAFASVQLRSLNDTGFKKLSATDKTGAFEINDLPFGYFRLSATYVGFAPFILDSIHLRAERFDFNLGDLRLKNRSDSLEEVIVYAEKPLVEMSDGKITYNVGESALSGGATTAEIIKTMPLISNDPNGKILLKGKEPKILIDDKPTDLTAAQLNDLLESLPGSSIEKIELMTNPPPQYANEAGGVINIVTKKGKIGWLGRVNMATGSRGEVNINSNVSYRKNKVALTITGGMGISRIKGSSYSRRENYYADSTSYFYTDGSYLNKNFRPNLRTQLDYEFNKRSSGGITYQGNLNFFDNNSTTQYTNLNNNKQVYRLSKRSIGSEGNGYSHGITLSYRYRGKKPAEVLQFIISGNVGKNDQDRDFFQRFLDANSTPTGLDSSQQQLTDNYNKAFSLRVNYDKPLKMPGSMFSTGVFYSGNINHNILNTNFLRQIDTTFVKNDLLSTDFEFRQKILQLRAAFTLSLSKTWKLIVGAIAENTHMNFEYLKGNTADVSNNYWNMMPHATLRKEFNKQVNTALVYRSNIRRPGIGELNPAIDYGDPYNIRFGNPYLQPQLADNFDWNVTFNKGKYYFNTSVGYNRVRDVFNTIRSLDAATGKTQVTWQNIANRNEYDASIWGGYTFSKKFRINSSIGYTFNEYGANEKLLYRYRDGGSFYTSFNYNFMPTPVLIFEGNARFSSFADPQGRSRSNISMNVGVQKKFFNKRLSVSLNIIDPFTTQQFTTFTYGSNFKLESFSQARTRNFRLSVSYQLNKIVQKKVVTDKQKKAAIDKARQSTPAM